MQLVKKLSILIFSLSVLAGCASGRTAFNKGQKYEGSGDLDQAVIKYAEAATANPEIGEYRLRFLKACAESGRLHLAKGDGFLASRNYADALREYQTASEESAADDPREGVAIRRHDQEVEHAGGMKSFDKPGIGLICYNDYRRLVLAAPQQAQQPLFPVLPSHGPQMSNDNVKSSLTNDADRRLDSTHHVNLDRQRLQHGTEAVRLSCLRANI